MEVSLDHIIREDFELMDYRTANSLLPMIIFSVDSGDLVLDQFLDSGSWDITKTAYMHAVVQVWAVNL